MSRQVGWTALAMCLFLGSMSAAATYYVDPAKGSDQGNGSADKPWKTLAGVVDSGQFKNVKGGDIILLRTGYHGEVKFSGENASMVTIAAEKGQRPTLSRLIIESGKNWTVRGLVISPSFASEPYKGTIVSFGNGGPSSEIIIEGCYIFTAADSSNWDMDQWMKANSGVTMGRHGKNLTLRNNVIRNTRFGVDLAAFDSLCEGNVISDFSADGIRATRDGLTVSYNIIKNVYVSMGDGDKNHDDGIQCFLFAKGTGAIKNFTFVGNIIIAHENPNQKLKNSLQGMGFFDGPLVNFVLTDNVIDVDAWHGIAIYDGQNCRVERNTVWTADQSAKAKAWIMFGNKLKQSSNNIAKDNYANSFKLNEPGTVNENNKICTLEIYQQSLAKAYKTICDKFGATHTAAGGPRMNLK